MVLMVTMVTMVQADQAVLMVIVVQAEVVVLQATWLDRKVQQVTQVHKEDKAHRVQLA